MVKVYQLSCSKGFVSCCLGIGGRLAASLASARSMPAATLPTPSCDCHMSWGGKGHKPPMLRTTGLRKGRAGRSPLRVDTLRAQTDEWATCALSSRVVLGCWLSDEEAWQVWENPENSQKTKLPAKHTLPASPALRLKAWAFLRTSAIGICTRARPGRNHGPPSGWCPFPHSLCVSLI